MFKGARRNFRRGGSKPKKVPHKDKKGPPRGEKVAKGPHMVTKILHPHKENVAKLAQHGEQVEKSLPNNKICFSKGGGDASAYPYLTIHIYYLKTEVKRKYSKTH